MTTRTKRKRKPGDIFLNVPIKPWTTPNYVITGSGSAVPVSEVPAEVLEKQLQRFRDEVLKKAGRK